MKLKKFIFPAFEKFYKCPHNLDWEAVDVIGEFRAFVEAYSMSSSSPTQFEFVARIVNKLLTQEVCYHSYFKWSEADGPEVLREWYEKTVEEINTAFEDYIFETYIVEP